MANGTTEIYAVVGQRYFVATVTVSGGSAPKAPYADYRTFADNAAIDTWLGGNDAAAIEPDVTVADMPALAARIRNILEN